MGVLDAWVTVVPETGKIKETARALLSLAEHPSQVRTLGTGDEFLVHPDVAERYTAPPKPRPSRAKKKIETETEEPQ